MAKHIEHNFSGFKSKYSKAFTTLPHHFVDEYLHTLSGAETQMMIFILRLTLGFQRTNNFISLSQFTDGIENLCKGTGLSNMHVRRCLKSLEEKGFIVVGKRYHRTSIIKLRLKDGEEPEKVESDESDIKSEDVIRLIRMFDTVTVWKRVEAFCKSPREIKAMRTVIDYYGLDMAEDIMTVLPETVNLEYCPTITSPSELLDRVAKLLAFFRRNQSNGTPQVSIRF